MNYNYKKINNITPYLNIHNSYLSKKDYNNVIQIDNFIRTRINILLYNYINNPLFNITKKENNKNIVKISSNIGSDLQICLIKNNVQYNINPICCGLLYNTYINLNDIISNEYYKQIEQYEKQNSKCNLYQSNIPSKPILMSRPKPTTTFEEYFNHN